MSFDVASHHLVFVVVLGACVCGALIAIGCLAVVVAGDARGGG